MWHLCTIQAGLQLLQTDAIWKSGQEAGAMDVDILVATAARGKQILANAEPLYRDALQQANIAPSPTYPQRPTA